MAMRRAGRLPLAVLVFAVSAVSGVAVQKERSFRIKVLGTAFQTQRSLPDPQTRNTQLKAELDGLAKMVEEGKETTEDLLKSVTANREKRVNGMNDYLNNGKKELQEKIDKLKKEYDEKKHCLDDHAEAHHALKEKVIGSLGKFSFLHANASSPDAPAEQMPVVDKMKYIEENKVLERKVAEAKDMVQHYKIQTQQYDAVKIRSDVDTKHWQKLLERMVVQMKTEQVDLEARIAVLDKRCEEVEHLTKPAVATAVAKIPQQVEKERLAAEAAVREKERKEREAKAAKEAAERARTLREHLARLAAEAARRLREAAERAKRRIIEARNAVRNLFRGWR